MKYYYYALHVHQTLLISQSSELFAVLTMHLGKKTFPRDTFQLKALLDRSDLPLNHLL